MNVILLLLYEGAGGVGLSSEIKTGFPYPKRYSRHVL